MIKIFVLFWLISGSKTNYDGGIAINSGSKVFFSAQACDSAKKFLVTSKLVAASEDGYKVAAECIEDQLPAAVPAVSTVLETHQ